MTVSISRKRRGFHAAKRWTLIAAAVCLLAPGISLGKSNGASSITAPLEKSVNTRQASQKELDKWEEERVELQGQYERLLKENEQLKRQQQALSERKAAQAETNASLETRKTENLRMSREIVPFLENTYALLADRIAQDAPFLKEERETRLARLREVLDDRDVGTGEKYRKVMEALFVEAEYGNTIEVYQEKILLDGSELLGDVFRLGRVSLFFQTLDRSTAAVYSVSEKKWRPLDEQYAPAIGDAVEMGLKRRPVELLRLPIGQISAQ